MSFGQKQQAFWFRWIVEKVKQDQWVPWRAQNFLTISRAPCHHCLSKRTALATQMQLQSKFPPAPWCPKCLCMENPEVPWKGVMDLLLRSLSSESWVSWNISLFRVRRNLSPLLLSALSRGYDLKSLAPNALCPRYYLWYESPFRSPAILFWLYCCVMNQNVMA